MVPRSSGKKGQRAERLFLARRFAPLVTCADLAPPITSWKASSVTIGMFVNDIEAHIGCFEVLDNAALPEIDSRAD
jgi:hypothetical protein